MNITAPLYVTGISPEGKFLLGGIFKMQDQHGFPLDASFEECKRYQATIDWLEALCDCWLNDCLKFESFVRQAQSMVEVDLQHLFAQTGAIVVAQYPKILNTKNPVDTVCRYILAKKRRRKFYETTKTHSL